MLDATDGEPVDGAEVSVTIISTGDETTVFTDSSGTADLGEFNVGALVEVEAVKSGYADYRRTRTIPANGQITINMSPTILVHQTNSILSTTTNSHIYSLPHTGIGR